MELTQERLRALVAYDPTSGVFTWRVDMRGGKKAGSVAGHVGREERKSLRIDGKLYSANRLAWLYMTGAWPAGVVDHRDLNPSNDAWSNLRDVSRSVNQENRAKAQRNNQSSGLLGVTFDRRRGKFIAQIKAPTRRKFIGYFESAEAAHQAYLAEKRVHHEGCTI